ncbi:Uncharacterised protein [Mycobacteroides abscessus subsp. abscessus]|nr:Uncharacterised protein [Mycobacteroides abscessus subsp. abscessus]
MLLWFSSGCQGGRRCDGLAVERPGKPNSAAFSFASEIMMLDALEVVAGAETRELVYDEPDPRVAEIVCSWPGEFDISRALALGLAVDEDFADVVRAHARLE